MVFAIPFVYDEDVKSVTFILKGVSVMNSTPKPWYKSVTVWFNVVMLILGIAPVVGASMKVLQPDASEIIDTIVALITGVGNVFIRVVFTNQPIGNPPTQ
jgi:hypothetical protein